MGLFSDCPEGSPLNSNKYTLPTRIVDWTDRERLVWTPPDNLSVSEWADRHRILHPLTSAEPGKWSTERTPYLREIMDSFSLPTVETITVCASTQVGKTECLMNFIGYACDQDPGPMLMVMPREEDVISIGSRRIRPMLEASPQLTRHLSEHKTDNKQKEIRFSRSMLYLAGSHSPADLSSRPVRYVLGDEIDKWPRFAGHRAEEGSPQELLTERTRTFWNRKVVWTSTPTTRDGAIWKSYERSDQRKYKVPCPHCGHFQTLEFPQIKWPEHERDPSRIRDHNLAWYECENCSKHIGDLDKPAILKQGYWEPSGTEGRHRGYHIHCCYSPWLTWSDIAAKFLESKDQPETLLNFVNSWLGAPWEEKTETIEVEHVETRTKEYERGQVPAEAIVLVAGIDVQQHELWYCVRAFGVNEESWLVECGRLEPGLEQLVTVLIKRHWTGVDGRLHKLRLACIDSGYRTDEVYQFCRHYSDIMRPIKGQHRISGLPIRSSKIDRNTSGELLKRSIRLFHIDTHHFKDKLARLMTAQDGEHGAWHLHDNVPAEYLKQITAEEKVFQRNRKTGQTSTVWKPKPGRSANHYLDCETYLLAAADLLAVFSLNESALETPDRTPPPSPSTRQDESPAPWIPKRKESWINGGR